MMGKYLIVLCYCIASQWLAAQENCTDLSRVCAGEEPVALRTTLNARCGETLTLLPTIERCNEWIIPPDFTTSFATDSTSLSLVIDNCIRDSIVVNGTTITEVSGQMTTCRTRLVYNIRTIPDTLEEVLTCEQYLSLDATEERIQGSCGCDSLIILYTADLVNCIGCGQQCIFLTGTVTISGGDTEGADVEVIYVLNGDTITTGRGDWTGEVDIFDCFDVDDTLTLLQVNAFPPPGSSGSASAEGWIVRNRGITDTTFLEQWTCFPEEIGEQLDTLTASTGCDSLVATSTLLYDQPMVELFSELACIGDTIILEAFSADALSYQWEDGSTDSWQIVTESGEYSVSITDENSCTATATTSVLFSDITFGVMASVAGPLLISASPLEVWQGAAIQLETEVMGTPYSYEILWNGGPQPGDSILNIVAQQTDTITVAAIDSIGCVGEDQIGFTVRPTQVFVPSAFSPNGDRTNDQFDIYTSPNVEEVRLQIFARSGALVFDQYLSSIPEQEGLRWPGWAGQFLNQRLTPQVFAYQVWYRAFRSEWKITTGDISIIY